MTALPCHLVRGHILKVLGATKNNEKLDYLDGPAAKESFLGGGLRAVRPAGCVCCEHPVPVDWEPRKSDIILPTD